jgi:hypothetical protein
MLCVGLQRVYSSLQRGRERAGGGRVLLRDLLLVKVHQIESYHARVDIQQ